MKLHLPHRLFAAVLATFSLFAAYTSSAENVISVNFGRAGDTVTSAMDDGASKGLYSWKDSTGTQVGVAGEYWVNICGNTAAAVNNGGNAWELTDNTAKAAGTLTLNAPRDPWNGGPNISTATSVAEGLARGYLDMRENTPGDMWKISAQTDYVIADVVVYMSGDNGTGNKFGSVMVNGTAYKGTDDGKTAVSSYSNGQYESWGTRAPNNTFTEGTNKLVVTGLFAESLEMQSLYAGTNRATIAGFQIIDRTAETLWYAQAGDIADASAANFTRNGTTSTLSAMAADDRYLSFADQSVTFTGTSTAKLLHAASDTVSVNAASGSLSADELLISQGATAVIGKGVTVADVTNRGALVLDGGTVHISPTDFDVADKVEIREGSKAIIDVQGNTTTTNFYLNSEEDILVETNGNKWHITGTRTGAAADVLPVDNSSFTKDITVQGGGMLELGNQNNSVGTDLFVSSYAMGKDNNVYLKDSGTTLRLSITQNGTALVSSTVHMADGTQITTSDGKYTIDGVVVEKDATGKLYFMYDKLVTIHNLSGEGTLLRQKHHDNGKLLLDGSVDITGLSLEHTTEISAAKAKVGTLSVSGGTTTVSGADADIGTLAVTNSSWVRLTGAGAVVDNVNMTGGAVLVAGGANTTLATSGVTDGSSVAVQEGAQLSLDGSLQLKGSGSIQYGMTSMAMAVEVLDSASDSFVRGIVLTADGVAEATADGAQAASLENAKMSVLSTYKVADIALTNSQIILDSADAAVISLENLAIDGGSSLVKAADNAATASLVGANAFTFNATELQGGTLSSSRLAASYTDASGVLTLNLADGIPAPTTDPLSVTLTGLSTGEGVTMDNFALGTGLSRYEIVELARTEGTTSLTLFYLYEWNGDKAADWPTADGSRSMGFFGGGTPLVDISGEKVGNLVVDTSTGTQKSYVFTGNGTVTATGDLRILSGGLTIGTSGSDAEKTAVVVEGKTEVEDGGTLTINDSLTTGTLLASGAAIISNTGALLTLTEKAESTVGSLIGGGQLKLENDATLVMQTAATMAASQLAEGSKGTIKMLSAGGDAPQALDLGFSDLVNRSTVNVDAAKLTLTGTGNTLGAVTLDTLVLDGSLLAPNTPYLNASSVAAHGETLAVTFEGLDMTKLTAGNSWDIIVAPSSSVTTYELDAKLVTDAIKQNRANLSFGYENGKVTLEATAYEGMLWETSSETSTSGMHIVLGGTDVYSSLDVVTDVYVTGEEKKTFDLTEADPAAGTDGLVVWNVYGDEGSVLAFEGDSLHDVVVLANDKAITAGMGKETLEVKSALLKVGGIDADDAAQPLHVGNIDLSSNARIEVHKQGITLGQLNGDETASVQGAFAIDGEGGKYYGQYDGVTLDMKAGADQTLLARQGLKLQGSAGTATLVYSVPAKTRQVVPGASIDSIATTGTNVTLENVDGGTMKTLTLGGNSTMEGGVLTIGANAADVYAGTAADITTGANLCLTNTKLVVNQADADFDGEVSFGSADDTYTLFRLAASVTGSTGVEVTLTGDFLSRYYTDARLLADGTVVANLMTSYYTTNYGVTENGKAGLTLLDEVLLTKNPQQQGSGLTDLAGVLNALDNSTSAAEADKLAAAVAGVSVPALGMALAGDVERQLKAIRNRTTVMGVDSSVYNMDMPYFNAWINAEGDYRDMDDDGTMAGYTHSSWGGTVGFDVDCNDSLTAGLALTAMYGDFESDAADRAEADTESYYVSAFARVDSGNWVHTFVGTFGLLNASLDRTVSHSGGSYATQADVEGFGAGLMYEVGYSIALDEDATVCLQPVANVAWRHVSLDGFDEEGSDAGLAVGEQEYNMLTFGLGARMQAVVGESIYNRKSILELRALAKFDAGDREGEAEVAMLNGHKTQQLRSAELGAVGAEVGLGFIVPVTPESSSLFMDVSAELRSGATSANATVGYRVNF